MGFMNQPTVDGQLFLNKIEIKGITMIRRPKWANWSSLFEDKSPEEFLKSEDQWGAGQHKDNPGRQFFINYLEEQVNNFNFKVLGTYRMLEIGFGSGIDYELIDETGLLNLSYFNYFGADVTPEFCQLGAQTMPKAVAITLIDGYALPYTDGFFDLVYMRHVLEHQENYRFLMKEVFRVCKKQIIVNFFIPPTEKEVDEIFYDNVFYHNVYSKKLLISFVNKYKWKLAEEHMFRKPESTDNILIFEKA